MIELINVSKYYPTEFGRHYVFRDVSLKLPLDKSVGILGPNGSGKSTFLRLLGGADTPSAGKIIKTGSISPPMGLTPGLQASLTASENMRFAGRIYGLSRDEINETIEFVRTLADIGKFFDMPVGTYSSGMKQRVSFAVNMSLSFDYYLFDEIGAGGDKEFKKITSRMVEERLKTSKFIVISHRVDELLELCDAGIIIQNGELTYYDDIREAITIYGEAEAMEKSDAKRSRLEQRKKSQGGEDGGEAVARTPMSPEERNRQRTEKRRAERLEKLRKEGILPLVSEAAMAAAAASSGAAAASPAPRARKAPRQTPPKADPAAAGPAQTGLDALAGSELAPPSAVAQDKTGEPAAKTPDRGGSLTAGQMERRRLMELALQEKAKARAAAEVAARLRSQAPSEEAGTAAAEETAPPARGRRRREERAAGGAIGEAVRSPVTALAVATEGPPENSSGTGTPAAKDRRGRKGGDVSGRRAKRRGKTGDDGDVPENASSTVPEAAPAGQSVESAGEDGADGVRGQRRRKGSDRTGRGARRRGEARENALEVPSTVTEAEVPPAAADGPAEHGTDPDVPGAEDTPRSDRRAKRLEKRALRQAQPVLPDAIPEAAQEEPVDGPAPGAGKRLRRVLNRQERAQSSSAEAMALLLQLLDRQAGLDAGDADSAAAQVAAAQEHAAVAAGRARAAVEEDAAGVPSMPRGEEPETAPAAPARPSRIHDPAGRLDLTQ